MDTDAALTLDLDIDATDREVIDAIEAVDAEYVEAMEATVATTDVAAPQVGIEFTA